MAHLIVEYSGNLEQRLYIQSLIDHLHRAAAGTGVFPLKGIRTRGAIRDRYRIADGHDANGFIHVIARIGQGRSPDVQQRASEALFLALSTFLDSYYKENPLAISLEMQEINSLTSHKQNNLPAWIEKRGSSSNE
ncbi:MAG: 5-carboxymethyl-2-hydroxymuconate isomerase [Pseudomonadota bacterium]